MILSDFQRQLKCAADQATYLEGDAKPLLDLAKDLRFSWSDKLWETSNGPGSLMHYVLTTQEKNDAGLAEALLELGADPGEQGDDGMPLWYYTVSCAEKLKLYLDRGVDPNAEHDRPGSDHSWPLPLMRAVCGDAYAGDSYIGSAELLLDHGACINHQDGRDFTVLHWAAYDGNFKMAHLLLDRGADPSITNRDDKTPLDILRKCHCEKEGFALLEGALEAGVQQKALDIGSPKSAEDRLSKRIRM